MGSLIAIWVSTKHKGETIAPDSMSNSFASVVLIKMFDGFSLIKN